MNRKLENLVRAFFRLQEQSATPRDAQLIKQYGGIQVKPNHALTLNHELIATKLGIPVQEVQEAFLKPPITLSPADPSGRTLIERDRAIRSKPAETGILGRISQRVWRGRHKSQR